MSEKELLHAGYLDCVSRAERLRHSVVVELNELFSRKDVTLGFPIESRVKTWASIVDKVDRKGKSLSSVLDLQDLIGLRVVLLFKKDLKVVEDIISGHFHLISSEDTSGRLGDSEFGYQSIHYSIKAPDSWLSLPTWDGLGIFTMELQVRTLAQHMWAAASHKLQYKQESSVPPPIRRSINRVSALLETVDLEIERVLLERDQYHDAGVSTSSNKLCDEKLNVDNLSILLSDVFPARNRLEPEGYADLLENLSSLGVDTVYQAEEIFRKHLDDALAEDQRMSESEERYYETAVDPRPADVYFKHVGLAREALRREFGRERVAELFSETRRKNSKK